MLDDTPSQTIAADTFKVEGAACETILPGVDKRDLLEVAARLAYEVDTPAARELREMLAAGLAIYGPTQAQLFGHVR